MVHSPEWTTGSAVFAGNQGKALILRELVVHFIEWTTGSFDFAGIQGKAPILSELVVHFTEWTTGSIQKSQQDGLAGWLLGLKTYWGRRSHLALTRSPCWL